MVGLLASPATLRAGTEIEPLRFLAIQDGGRTKPLDTFAREAARRLTGARAFGAESVNGLDPIEWLLSLHTDPARWEDAAFIRVTHAGLRQAAGLPNDRDRYSFKELLAHEPFTKAVDAVHAKLRTDREARLDPVERELAELYDNLALMRGIATGEALHVIPHPTDPEAAWFSLAEIQSAPVPEVQRVDALVTALTGAYRSGDHGSAEAAASALRRRLAQLAPGVYPSEKILRTEVRYNRSKPFRLAWFFYLLGFLVVLASFPLASRAASLLGIGLAAAGFLAHSWGMLLRMQISGRPPVTNMYESVVFVAWGAMLFALVFEAIYRSRYFVAAAAAVSTISLILADNVPILDGSIAPLVPVLRHNMWLTIHVLTITLGYAAFTLAMGLGHIVLGLHFLAPGKAALQKNLSLFLYRSIQVGTLFLAVGTLLGGVWASYSWGRFWGWDPKEVWALISLLGYLAVLHAKHGGWVHQFGLAALCAVCFSLVVMAWYGVNFVLGAGLHSYGFGGGGTPFVVSAVCLQALWVAAAGVRYAWQRREEREVERLRYNPTTSRLVSCP